MLMCVFVGEDGGSDDVLVCGKSDRNFHGKDVELGRILLEGGIDRRGEMQAGLRGMYCNSR